MERKRKRISRYEITTIVNGQPHAKRLIVKPRKYWFGSILLISGGIRKNSDVTINRYVDDTDYELVDGGLNGVASWSKILSIRDPLAFAIYDARVAFSLNALQIRSADGLKVWFPLLATQNTTLARVQPRFGLLRNGAEQIARKNTYRCYLTALAHVVGEGRPEDAEMILFAMAPSLAEEWERANPS